jgi:hypothetical protein
VIKKKLGLRPGEWVEVRSRNEILATLDGEARLGALPFMPEMLRFCGQRFTVYKRADKTCDTIDKTGARRLYDTVHLAGLRCDGSAHGGCEASCLMFWKEAWLKRVDSDEGGGDPAAQAKPTTDTAGAAGCTEGDIERAAVRDRERGIYRCQITQLKEFTEPLAWWDVRQYARDVLTNRVPVGQVARSFIYAGYRKLVDLGVGYRALIALFDWFQALRGGIPYPDRSGRCTSSPSGELGLQVGELVRVKSYSQILETLNSRNRNRGLYFDAEMVKFCGNRYRVAKRVGRILEEKSGKMLEFSNPCIILQDVYCRADVSKYRLFCPRSIFPYWREIWLERVDERELVNQQAS